MRSVYYKEVNIMEMERINEDTILLRIKNEDLQERGTSVADLLGNPGDIEGFFHSILIEMGVLDQFEDSDGMSFQMMPNPNGLELYVTKLINDQDSVDNERFIKNLVDTLQHSLSQRDSYTSKKKAGQKKMLKADTPQPLDCTFVFERFEDFVALAKVYKYPVQQSTLYRYSNHYFLRVYQEVAKGEDISNDIALLREFGEYSRISWEVLQEYGQVMIPTEALETARNYF